MGEAVIRVAEDTTIDRRVHTWNRFVNGTRAENNVIVAGEHNLPTYAAQTGNTSIATANAHIFQLMASANNYLRIRRIHVIQDGLATAVGVCRFQLVRVTTAGTGGVGLTEERLDSANDVAAGGVATVNIGTKGTEGDVLWTDILGCVASGTPTWNTSVNWQQLPNSKPFIVTKGTSNGVVLKVSGLAGATVAFTVEWSETTWL